MSTTTNLQAYNYFLKGDISGIQEFIFRFWWRALHSHLNLEELKEREDYLFGGTQGRSKVLLRIQPIEELISSETFERKCKKDKAYSLIYMAYGAVDRYYYETGTKFNVIFSINENNQERLEEIKKEIKSTFSVLSILGGLGAKSRNGFGSFVTRGIDSFEDIKNYPSFQSATTSSYTSISSVSQIYQSSRSFRNWKSAINELQELYAGNKKAIFPKSDRVYIGAPWKRIKTPDRHAKLHIMSLIEDDDQYKYIITYLPYNYLIQYPDLNSSEITKYHQNWEKTVKKFNNYIANDQGGNPDGDYLVNFTFND